MYDHDPGVTKRAYGELSSQQMVDELLRLVNVEALEKADGEAGLFRGRRRRGGEGRVYGGQVIAQALAAASKTVEEGRQVHSLHAYFLRGGSEEHEIDYRVAADFDGGSFSNRRVVAMQQDKVIFNLAASFHKPERGHELRPAMPDVPPPEKLMSIAEFIEAHPERTPRVIARSHRSPTPIEVRCVGAPPFWTDSAGEPELALWFRVARPVEGPQWLHRALLAYASDYTMVATMLRGHEPFDVQAASIDHSLWFHQDVEMGEWLLFTTQSPWTGAGRGFSLGQIYNRAGELVASVAQEGLIRDPALRAG
ncbi:MAG: acyl-CoA thioesterase II [Sphingobium sp.]|nr:acyl-CoA thioesterase II [Sphingobium sp.]